MQVKDLVEEVVDGLIVVLDGPGLVVRSSRKPRKSLDRSTTSHVEIIHHLWWDQLKLNLSLAKYRNESQILDEMREVGLKHGQPLKKSFIG